MKEQNVPLSFLEAMNRYNELKEEKDALNKSINRKMRFGDYIEIEMRRIQLIDNELKALLSKKLS